MGKASDGADATCSDLLRKLELRAVVDAHLIYLVAPRLTRGNPFHRLFCAEHAAGYLEPNKTLAAIAMAHSVHARSKVARPGAFFNKLVHAIQELVHALVFEGRSVKAREEGTLTHQTTKRRQ